MGRCSYTPVEQDTGYRMVELYNGEYIYVNTTTNMCFVGCCLSVCLVVKSLSYKSASFSSQMKSNCSSLTLNFKIVLF